MNFEKVMLCRWVDLQYLSEKESIGKGYTIGLFDYALSNVGPIPVAFMIFIGKTGDNEYEVRVYKAKKEDRFIQKYDEYIPKYIETDEYTSFYFYCYYSAHKFTDKLLPYHKEYDDRPVQPIVLGK